MKNNTIKYRYAYDKNEEVVDASLIIKRELYVCISCGNVLIFKKGTRTPHFAHKNLSEKCSRETYLHKLAKKKFVLEYNKALHDKNPFFLEYNSNDICNSLHSKTKLNCNLGVRKKRFDLTKRFHIIEEEKRDGVFTPDILLTDGKKDRIYIEIRVTHKSDEKKISSGIKIIEFNIEEESDCDIFVLQKIPLQHKKIERFNFKENDVVDNFCNGNCLLRHKVFCVYKSGKSICKNFSLSEYADERNKFVYSEILYSTTHKKDPFCSDMFFKKVIESYRNEVPIKNCIFCRYHSVDPNSSGQIFCKFLKKRNTSNYAADCNYYKPDSKVLSEYDFWFKHFS